jgi:hypothetical protein
MSFNYVKNSYRDEFIDFPSRSYSRALPCTSSHEPNHCSYGFGSQENCFEPRRFGYGPHPHRGDRFLRRPDFLA